jgi:hypothetical protein
MKLTREVLQRMIEEVINEQDAPKLEEPPDPSKFIDVDNGKEQYTAIQRKYLDIIQDLQPEELKQIKAMFCFDRYSIDQLNSIGLAQRGKLKDK